MIDPAFFSFPFTEEALFCPARPVPLTEALIFKAASRPPRLTLFTYPIRLAM